MTTRRNGFTLVELMVTLAMTGIIIAAVYSTYTVQQRAYGKQEQVAEVQQNIRAAIYNMAQEIRMAGYDPEGTADAGLTKATKNTIEFTMDIDDGSGKRSNSDGDVNDSGEKVEYTLTGGNLTRNGQVLATTIEKLEFWYTLADNSKTLTPTKFKDIRAITISILGRSPKKDSHFTDDTQYKSASGEIWTPTNNKHHRHRFLTTTIQCRNMGL